ncbi:MULTISPECIES: glycosyltransferase family 4 protein [unclassified Paracoccus (in: a-proteobacteria)]|uniref:glycosyltransferase family 4 protein n=1 Tax=unclassified Paracoccus (in: a-proteobacteria) TaxID=2688777 RepID=UPI0021E11677|nr:MULTISPECIES: glycosyltransferase family 1 protein [unclassified Paracoccus (in: a-proteobacteria)]UXU75579.1 glycosyltransferase family 4 protein [Paracoccus sp. SMMA_5]UXU81483.1 glycosyltransferase family 4 protein [Paracoccus sp. SMMA_5_TC]
MTADRGILLDVSRLVSRLGRGPLTGIDRVEAEWLAHLQGRRHLLLCRAGRAQWVLDPAAGALLLGWLANRGNLPPAPGLLARLRLRLGRGPATGALHALAPWALRRAGRDGQGLGAFVLAHLGAGAAYLNVGHSNIAPRLWQNLRPLIRAVLLHDTIPLDHPEFTRAGQSQRFQDRFRAAMQQADLVLAISAVTRDAVLEWSRKLAVDPHAPVVIAPIGTRLTAPAPTPPLPAGLPDDRPLFLTLGTIEPRKNHALLLDAWAQLPAGPMLVIAGRRGWENREVFARLDALAPGAAVRECGDLDDAEVAALMQHCHALLMPSRAEGFGLPLTEAAARGVPILCSPLPVAREILGDYPIYLPADAPSDWASEIARLAAVPRQRLSPARVPGWEAHFAAVAAALAGLVARPRATG